MDGIWNESLLSSIIMEPCPITRVKEALRLADDSKSFECQNAEANFVVPRSWLLADYEWFSYPMRDHLVLMAKNHAQSKRYLFCTDQNSKNAPIKGFLDMEYASNRFYVTTDKSFMVWFKEHEVWGMSDLSVIDLRSKYTLTSFVISVRYCDDQVPSDSIVDAYLPMPSTLPLSILYQIGDSSTYGLRASVDSIYEFFSVLKMSRCELRVNNWPGRIECDKGVGFTCE